MTEWDSRCGGICKSMKPAGEKMEGEGLRFGFTSGVPSMLMNNAKIGRVFVDPAQRQTQKTLAGGLRLGIAARGRRSEL